MKISGIKISLVLLFLILFEYIYAQNCAPQPNICFDSNCTPPRLALITDPNISFCQGLSSTITLDLNQTSTFDSFYVYWCDGTFDKYPGNQATFSHVYEGVNETTCTDLYSLHTITVVGRQFCSQGLSCGNASTTIRVQKKPIARFSFLNQLCYTKEITFSNSSCYVDEALPDAYIWDFGDDSQFSNQKNPRHKYNSPGTYQVKLTVKSKCGQSEISASNTLNITVVDQPNAIVELSSNARDSIVCIGDTVTMINKSNQWSNIIWTFPSNNILTDTTRWKLTSDIRKLEKRTPIDTINKLDTIRFVVLQKGTFRFELNSTNDCGNRRWLLNLKVEDKPVVNILTPTSFCESAQYRPQITTTGEIFGYEWYFPGGIPETSNTRDPGIITYNSPGTYTVNLQIFAPCDTFTLTTNVIVESRQPVKITDPMKVFCKTAGPDTLRADRSGGIWQGPGIVNASIGVFNPAALTPGNYTIRYVVGPPHCQAGDSIRLTVVDSAPVTASDALFCIDFPATQLMASPATGIWTGHPALRSDGVFDPSVSGAGSFIVKYQYTDPNNCFIERNVSVVVEDLPVLNMLDSVSLCIGQGSINLSDIFELTVNSTGGSYQYWVNGLDTGPSIQIGNYTEGSYPVRVSYIKNACMVVDSAVIVFVPQPMLMISGDTTICVDKGTLTLMTNTNGGIWDGPGIHPSTGSINLSQVNAGDNLYTYTINRNTSCEQTLSVKVTVQNPGIGLIAGPNESICEGPSEYLFSGFAPSGGLWSGDGIDPASGRVDLSALKKDTFYTYFYCLTNSIISDCRACSDKTLIIRSLPEVSFTVDGLTCINQNIQIINTSPGSVNNVFNLGDGNSSVLNSLTHQYVNKGTYTIQLDITDQYNCTNSTSREIYVTEKPVASLFVPLKSGCAPFNLEVMNTSSGDDISFLWHIHGQQYTTQNPPSIILDGIIVDSIFRIKLDVTNQCGTVTATDSVLIFPYPITKFGIDILEGCSPLAVTFANNTLGNPQFYRWDMGNGNVFINNHPSPQIYTTTKDSISVYQIKLCASNQCGQDSIIREIRVFPPDVEAFIESPGITYCQYDSITVSAFSTTGAINTWQITGPDNRVSGGSGDALNLKFENSGRYTVILFASRCGTDTDTVYFDILPAPELDFSLPAFACLNNEVLFVNTSQNVAGTLWDFGDGTTLSSFDGRHNYLLPGRYTVRMTAYSLINNCPFTISKEILIVGVPVASFSPSVYSGCTPLKVNFINSSMNGEIFDWDFGDGASRSNERDPVHTFTIPGTVPVRLRVYDSFGCFADTNVLNIIIHPLPVSRFEFQDKKYCAGYDTIRFVNMSSGAVGYEWNISGENFIQRDLDFFSPDFGVYNVSLVVVTDFGCRDTFNRQVQVLPSPVSDFSPDKNQVCVPMEINFDNLSQYADSYIWDFGTGAFSIIEDPFYRFENPGNYQVKLIAKNQNGCPADTSTREIIIHPRPSADFDFRKDMDCGVPTGVDFMQTSIGGLSYDWFINGQLVNQNPSFRRIFSGPGTYDILHLTVNEFDCRDSIVKTISLFDQPVADFIADDKNCEGDVIAFDNLSINANYYEWWIESIGILSEEDPVIQINEPGIYTVRLIAFNNELCKDTLVRTAWLKVFDKPDADFTYQTGFEENILGEVKFLNLSEKYDRSIWDFGDGNSSTDDNPYHEYDINRDVTVRLVVFNDNGGLFTCTDSINQKIAPEWITTFYAPNALSPEYGDALTSVFRPVGRGIERYEISVYSPWGEKVWYSDQLTNNAPAEEWDGTYKGAIVPQGAYSWIAHIRFVNGVQKVFKGSVTVVR